MLGSLVFRFLIRPLGRCRWKCLTWWRRKCGLQHQVLYGVMALGKATESQWLAAAPPKRPGFVRLVFISDTHLQHRDLDLPGGDILVHCGDVLLESRAANVRDLEILQDFQGWLQQLPHRHKLLVAGNHDGALQELGVQRVRQLLPACRYLQDEHISLEGLELYASPLSVGKSGNAAFQPQGGYDEAAAVEAVPEGLDLLITHGPAGEGALGRASAPLEARLALVKPRAHVFGHYHLGHGIEAVAEGGSLQTYREVTTGDRKTGYRLSFVLGPLAENEMLRLKGWAFVSRMKPQSVAEWFQVVPDLLSRKTWSLACARPQAQLLHRDCPWGGRLVKLHLDGVDLEPGVILRPELWQTYLQQHPEKDVRIPWQGHALRAHRGHRPRGCHPSYFSGLDALPPGEHALREFRGLSSLGALPRQNDALQGLEGLPSARGLRLLRGGGLRGRAAHGAPGADAPREWQVPPGFGLADGGRPLRRLGEAAVRPAGGVFGEVLRTVLQTFGRQGGHYAGAELLRAPQHEAPPQWQPLGARGPPIRQVRGGGCGQEAGAAALGAFWRSLSLGGVPQGVPGEHG
ncbi:unnamed protein product [Effrenium voratum]|nr:unnamed protein product [Effrenium voratum]